MGSTVRRSIVLNIIGNSLSHIIDNPKDISLKTRYIGKHVHGHTDRRTRTHGHLWKRRTVMEKTGSYGKDGHLWKRRTLMEKTDTYGKDGHLWKRRTLYLFIYKLCRQKFIQQQRRRYINTA